MFVWVLNSPVENCIFATLDARSMHIQKSSLVNHLIINTHGNRFNLLLWCRKSIFKELKKVSERLSGWANIRTWDEWLIWVSTKLVQKTNTKQRLYFVTSVDALWREWNRRQHGEVGRDPREVCIYISSIVDLCVDMSSWEVWFDLIVCTL